MRVLVVDDEDGVREVMAEILRELGHHEVLLASDGQEAWQLLDYGAVVDCILSDKDMPKGMPKLGGIEFLRRVKADHRTCDTPFILMSGDSVVSARDSTPLVVICALFDGAPVKFLEKPFKANRLLALVDEMTATPKEG